MRAFDIDKLKERPDSKLILRHYRKDLPKIWAIEQAQTVIGNLLLIKTPQTGYDTEEYVLVDHAGEVRDKNGNPVGNIEFATEKTSLEGLAGRLFNLPIDESIDFSFDEEDECWFGASKIKLFDSTLVIIAAYGGGESHLYDVSDALDEYGLFEHIQQVLHDYMGEEQSVYIDLCPKSENELWGVTFDYEDMDGALTRRLAVTDSYDLFKSKLDAKMWIAEHIAGNADWAFDAGYSGNPKAVLIEKWKG